MKRYYLLLFLTLFSLSTSYYLLSDQALLRQDSGGQVQSARTKKGDVTVSLSIGEYQFTLFGYSSPKALVTIEGLGIYDQTYADNRGYFEFKNRFSPFSPREACLSARDQFGRNSAPSCLPPFPTNRNVTIGPVILPPTLSLDKPDYFIGDEVILSGQTIPNSEVDLSVFTKNKSEILNPKSEANSNYKNLNNQNSFENLRIKILGIVSDFKIRASNLFNRRLDVLVD